MKIQFVCTGNTFRSRIAEAYLKSKNLKGLGVSSSGILADRNLNGPVCTYTVTVLKNHDLLKYMSNTWCLTKKSDLENQDLVVFMKKDISDFCLSELGVNIADHETWEVNDIPPAILSKGTMAQKNQKAEQAYQQIKQLVDRLALPY
jgi:protein-tyrosine-phosphatase